MQLELRKFQQNQTKVEHQLSEQMLRLTEQLDSERRLRMDSEEKFGNLPQQPCVSCQASYDETLDVHKGVLGYNIIIE